MHDHFIFLQLSIVHVVNEWAINDIFIDANNCISIVNAGIHINININKLFIL